MPTPILVSHPNGLVSYAVAAIAVTPRQDSAASYVSAASHWSQVDLAESPRPVVIDMPPAPNSVALATSAPTTVRLPVSKTRRQLGRGLFVAGTAAAALTGTLAGGLILLKQHAADAPTACLANYKACHDQYGCGDKAWSNYDFECASQSYATYEQYSFGSNYYSQFSPAEVTCQNGFPACAAPIASYNSRLDSLPWLHTGGIVVLSIGSVLSAALLGLSARILRG